jgi:hypothetical protein
MLTVNENERISAEDALNHDWFKKFGCEEHDREAITEETK